MSQYDTEIDAFIDRVVEHGSNYRLSEMEELYTHDQSILFVSGERAVHRVSRSEMLAEFAARGEAGDKPLETTREVLHVEQQGDHATALLYRRMSSKAPAALYELRMRREGGNWKVSGETVVAFPQSGVSEDFLPPRQH
ncbi:hypothetical protein K3177_14895 [Qipengyuania sp. GH25]|uniref:DUF4440 domain-containing protein n=1 Tax=Qipengyuania pacifica TaxID=2860199 RepID=A0ABS7JK83_9SPHN|nr:hypothetical protein [Qipengyuania aerophila]MBX7489793.1 hypothetical protein [Qipengyuania aerophila]